MARLLLISDSLVSTPTSGLASAGEVLRGRFAFASFFFFRLQKAFEYESRTVMSATRTLRTDPATRRCCQITRPMDGDMVIFLSF